MAHRIHDLTLPALHGLPFPCRSCVFWEVAGAPHGVPGGGEEAGTVAKEAWWQATQLEWGTPGKAAYVDDHLVGFATFAPSTHFPRARRIGPAVSDDALLLATLWVDPAYRGLRLGTALLQSVLRETHRRGARALEAYGQRGVDPTVPAQAPCVLPEGWLLRAGFALRQEHRDHPLLRLDLRQTVRWQESVSHAVEGVLSALSRRERAPVPVRQSITATRPAARPPAPSRS